ncbi:MATE family efflux transporter [Cetobacterium sp.]|uniref:MATE family efflux transporter n=1 Tax=Cetobacterium sp. TaxID=2071632 RepID=UPI003EE61CC8
MPIQTNQLENQPINKLFYKFAIPASIGMLVNSLYVVADGVFISRGIGSIGIAAVNIGYPIINLTAALSLMFGAGGATLISLKSDNQEFKNKCFTYTIILNLIFYVLIASLVFMFPNQIMKSLGATELLLPMVKGYMYPCIIATFFLMLSISLNAIVRNDNAPKKAMNSLFIGAITNIVLDYVFIFTLKMGIEGGAYATAIGQILSAIYLCLHFPNSTFRLKFNPKEIEWRLMGKICSLGLSSFILEFAVMVITVLLNITLSKSEGQIGVAAYGIISYSFVIYRMLFTGLAQGIQPLVSFNYGRRNYRRVLKIFRYSHRFCFISAAVALIIAKIFALDVVKIFTTESNLFEYTAKGLFLYSSAIIFVGANFMNISYLQSMDKALLANIISVCRGVVFMAIGIIILPKFLGVNGIWLTLPFADVLTFILTLIIFKVFGINKNLKKSSI